MRFTLKTALLRHGTSQRRLAVACGIPENRLSEIICGWLDPRPEEQARISAYLGLPMDPSLFDVDRTVGMAAVETRGRR